MWQVAAVSCSPDVYRLGGRGIWVLVDGQAVPCVVSVHGGGAWVCAWCINHFNNFLQSLCILHILHWFCPLWGGELRAKRDYFWNFFWNYQKDFLLPIASRNSKPASIQVLAGSSLNCTILCFFLLVLVVLKYMLLLLL